MFSGILALLERSLRVDARALSPHLARCGLAIGIYITLLTATASSTFFGAPGLRFFRSIVHLDLFFITLLGVTFFSTSITEEREEDTLGLMLMAGISPLGLLIGKSGGRLIQAFLLMAVQYPFTLLAITLGGITQHQIRQTYVSILAYLIFLAGAGLLCSTLSRRNRSASARLCFIVFLYGMLPVVSHAMLREFKSLSAISADILHVIGQSCIFYEIDTLMTATSAESIWTIQVITNSILGALGFVLSWLCFGMTSREPTSEIQSRGPVARSHSGKLLAPGPPWSLPVAWKDFHFIAGGKSGFLARLTVYVSIYLLIAEFSKHSSGFATQAPEPRFVTGFYLTLVMLLVPIDAGWMISRSFGDELRSQTLAPLILLPISTGTILYSKVVGALFGWLPGLACLILGIFFLPDGIDLYTDFFRHPGPPILIVTHLILIPHLAALLSVFVRWGALPISIGLTIGILFLIVSFFAAIRLSDDNAIVYLPCFLIYVLCIACHIGVRLRIDTLVSR